MKDEMPNPIDSLLKEFFEGELNTLLNIKQRTLQYLDEIERMVIDSKLKIAINELLDQDQSQMINLRHWMEVNKVVQKSVPENFPDKLSRLLAKKKEQQNELHFQKTAIKSVVTLKTLQIYTIDIIKLTGKQLNYEMLLFEAMEGESKQIKLQFNALLKAISQSPTYKLRLVKY